MITQLLLLALAAGAVGVFCLAAIRWPVIMALLAPLTMGLDYLGRLGAGVLTVNNLAKLLFLLLFFLGWLLRNRPVRVPWHLLLFLPLLLVTGIAVLYSAWFPQALLSWGRFLFVWSFAVLVANVLTGERHLRAVLDAMAIAALMVSAIAVVQGLQVFQEGALAIHGKEEVMARGIRVSGGFWNPNRMAVFLVGLATFLVAALPVRTLGRGRKAAYVLAIAASLVAVFMSLSRSGFIALGLTLLLFLFSRRHRPLAASAAFAAAVVAVALLMRTGYAGQLMVRLGSFAELSGDASTQIRWHLLFSGLRIFAHGFNWLWGCGHMAFDAAYVSFLHPLVSHDAYYHVGIRGSHTLAITILAEQGLIGASAALIFTLGIYRRLSLLLGERGSDLQHCLLVAILIMVTVKLVDFGFNPNFKDNLFWFALGLLGALGAMREADAATAAPAPATGGAGPAPDAPAILRD
ncbi:MAG: O-antigen ligase family protein [Candidatus Krumholzibacteriota bacterium]|nr:O-antigen ligase family protein [Candidatus Krumholzibacteriota bacterium]